MKKRIRHTHQENLDRWLLTYADLITLLLGLFVILYAVSKIDAGKYNEIMSALGGVFGSPRSVLAANGVPLDHQTLALENERQRIMRDIQRALGTEYQNLPVSVSESERGVTVHIMEEMLFPSGSAEIKQASLATLDSLAGVLRRLPNDLRVEGHTDNVPIKTVLFPSNWHLSIARALNIGYYLIQVHGLQADKVAIVGYSEYHPLEPNDTPGHRAKNRRVDIVIVSGTATNTPRDLPGRNELPIQRSPEKVL